MRRIIAIHLLLVFFYYSAGYYPVFICRLKSIKSEIKLKMAQNPDESELTQFTFTAAEYQALNWKEPGEFYFGEDLFDVIKEDRLCNGKILVYCFNDSQEKSLYDQASEQAQRNQSDNDNFFNLIKGAFLVSSVKFVRTPDIASFNILNPIPVPVFHPDIPSPPPKFA